MSTIISPTESPIVVSIRQAMIDGRAAMASMDNHASHIALIIGVALDQSETAQTIFNAVFSEKTALKDQITAGKEPESEMRRFTKAWNIYTTKVQYYLSKEYKVKAYWPDIRTGLGNAEVKTFLDVNAERVAKEAETHAKEVEARAKRQADDAEKAINARAELLRAETAQGMADSIAASITEWSEHHEVSEIKALLVAVAHVLKDKVGTYTRTDTGLDLVIDFETQIEMIKAISPTAGDLYADFRNTSVELPPVSQEVVAKQGKQVKQVKQVKQAA